MSIRAAIFDLDGTLLDSLEDLADSMNEALDSLGFPIHPLERYRYFVGDGIHILVSRTLPQECQDPATVAEAVSRYRTAYGRNWMRKSRPYQGIPGAIEDLRNIGLPLAVLSNKPQHFTELCMGQFFVPEQFAAIFGQRDHVPRKPDPAGAMEIARQLGVLPSEVAFVGDTKTDMDTATAAGMTRIGVAWGFRPVAELLESGADFIAQGPADLLRLLGQA